MRLCLSCFHLWPGDSKFCGNCHRTLGGRLCPKSHLSPKESRCCVHCGSTKLTKATSCLHLGRTLFSVVLIGGAALLFRGGLPQTQSLSAAASHAANHVVSLCIQWAVYALIFYWVLHLVPGGIGAGIRTAYVQGIGAILKLAKTVAFGFVRGLLSLFGIGKTKT